MKKQTTKYMTDETLYDILSHIERSETKSLMGALRLLQTEGKILVEADMNKVYHSVYSIISKKLPEVIEILNKPGYGLTHTRTLEQRESKKQTVMKREHIENVRRMYLEEKMSLREVGDVYGVTSSTILYFLRRHDIPVRTKAEGIRISTRKPEYRKLMSELANQGVVGVFCHKNQPYRDTKIELLFKKYLDALDYVEGTDYIREYSLFAGGHRYDFYIPSADLLVEVDGVYWHSTKTQSEKDRKFEAEALELGYEVVRFTDKEIDQNPGIFHEELNDRLYATKRQ